MCVFFLCNTKAGEAWNVPVNLARTHWLPSTLLHAIRQQQQKLTAPWCSSAVCDLLSIRGNETPPGNFPIRPLPNKNPARIMQHWRNTFKEEQEWDRSADIHRSPSVTTCVGYLAHSSCTLVNLDSRWWIILILYPFSLALPQNMFLLKNKLF